MKKLTQLALSLSLIGVTFSLPLPVMAADMMPATKNTTQTKKHISLLFVIRAETGTISKTDQGYKVKLAGMNDDVLYFSNRPVRKAGFININQFLSDWVHWKDSFQANPPNAAFTHATLKVDNKGIAQAVPVELLNPVVSDNELSFDMRDLKGTIKEGTYQKFTIFVDDGWYFGNP